MKIGISTIGYQCEEHLRNVVAPWKSSDVNAEVFISASHGLFPEVAALGFPQMSTDKTISILEELRDKKLIDNLIITERPLFERDLRNITLPFLFEKKIDLLWLLDLQDEIYTPTDINNILKFIEQDKYPTWFKIRFKNYVINNRTFVDDFVAPRIWRMDRCDGVKEFYYDNEIIYNNGVKQEFLPNEIIPKEIAYVKHLSWCGSGQYLKRKIAFAHNHYGHCSYRWNEESECLELDKSYYISLNKKMPILHFEG